jgi:hypothetical protein
MRLIRHKHGSKYQRLVYQDAIRGDCRFEQYQSGQGNPRVIAALQSAATIAAFVVSPRAETVFVGLWRVAGLREVYTPDPYFAAPRSRGRIVVDWGRGERAWVQYAARQDKAIVEVRREAEVMPFPGFGRLDCGLHEIDGLPSSWLAVLQSTRGVYLIVHRESGAQYVGAATGADGLLGRWRGYADGHGGNAGLRDLAEPADRYDVRILETVGSGATTEEILALEALWKQKLGSRTRGLNRN